MRPGEIKIGPSVKVGYYAQEHETLDFNQTVIDAVRLWQYERVNAVSFLIATCYRINKLPNALGRFLA